MYNSGAESSVTCPTTLDRTPCGPNASGLSALSSKPLCHAPCCWSVDGLDMLISHKKKKNLRTCDNSLLEIRLRVHISETVRPIWTCFSFPEGKLPCIASQRHGSEYKALKVLNARTWVGQVWLAESRFPASTVPLLGCLCYPSCPQKNGSELAWSVTFPLDGVPEAAKNKTKSASFYISWPNSTPVLSLWEESWWGCSVMVA